MVRLEVKAKIKVISLAQRRETQRSGASMGLAVEAEDGDVGCSSDLSDEGFVALVQGDLSNTNSISESGGVVSDVGDGLASQEGKNRDRYFDWVVRWCELQIPRS